MIQTKDRILDAAERLFAEQGYSATSLRSIIAAAGVNLAAVHYHFHSKESLLEAVILRRAEPANQERLELLERYQAEAGGRPPALEKVLEAFLIPTFRLACDPSRGGNVFVKLMGRLHAESDLLPGIILAHFGPVLMRFSEALNRALPELPASELLWRGRLAMGTAAQVLRDTPQASLSTSEPVSQEWEHTMRRLISYLCAGFRSPVVPDTRIPEVVPLPETAPVQETK